MYEQFKQELRDFFIQYSISVDVGKKIFTDWILKKSELEVKVEGFSISGSDKEVFLSIGGLSLDDLHHLLKFLEVDEAKYKTNSSIPLSKTFLDKFFTAFKEEWQQLYKETPKKILPYQIESQQSLESGAINNISQTASSLSSELKPEENELDMQLSLKLLALNNVSGYNYEKNTHFITRLYSEIQQFVNSNPNYKTNEKLTKLLDFFAEYAKFNRLEIKQLVKQFFKDLEVFLNKFQISETTSDVFENIIYQMAGITEIPQKNKLETSYSDTTRINFEVTNMSDENLAKLMNYFKELGDETVIKNPKSRHYSGHLESMSIEKSMISPDIHRRVKLKEDIIQVDGEFLATTVFPLFQTHLSKLAKENLDLLKPYQEKSKELMELLAKSNQKSKEPKVSSLGIFGSNVIDDETLNMEEDKNFILSQ